MRVALVGARPALPGRGDGGPRRPAVREVPAVEGPRRALGRLRREPAGRATWCTSPTERVRRPGAATPAATSTSTSSPPQLPAPADASQLRAIAEAGAGRTFVLEGPPGTGKSQTITNLLTRAVAEGKRVLFVAEKRAALDVVARRLDAVGMGMFALDLHDKGIARLDGARADPAGAGARGRRRRAGPGRRRRRTCARPAACWPATPTGCTTANAVGLSLYSARTAELAAGTDVEPLPVPLPFVANAPAEVLRPDPAGAGAAARHRRPDPALAAPPVGVRRLPRHRPARHPGRGRRRRRRRCARLPAIAELVRRAAARADARRPRRAGPPARPARPSGSTSSTRRSPAAGRRRRRAVLGEIAAFTAFRHPGLDVCDPRGAARCRWPRSTWPRRPPRRRPGSGRRRRLIAVRDRLAPYLRPGAKVKPKDVPALVENLWRVQTAVQAIAGAGRRRSRACRCRRAGTRSLDAAPARRARSHWLRRAGAAVDGSTPFHVQLRKLIVAGLPAGPAAGRRRRRGCGTPSPRCCAVCASSTDQLAAWAGDDGFVLRWSMTRPERGVDSSVLMSLRRWVTFLDTLEPLRYAGLFDARAAARHRRGHGRRRRPRLRPRPGRGLGDRAAGRDRARPVRRRGRTRRRSAGSPRASRAVREHLTAALPAQVLGTAAVRRGVGLRPGRRAAAGAGQAAPRAGRARSCWRSTAS